MKTGNRCSERSRVATTQNAAAVRPRFGDVDRFLGSVSSAAPGRPERAAKVSRGPVERGATRGRSHTDRSAAEQIVGAGAALEAARTALPGDEEQPRADAVTSRRPAGGLDLGG